MLRSFVATLMVALWLLPAAASEQKVRAFTASLADKAVSIMNDDKLSEKGKLSELEALFTQKVDFNWVARFVLGKHWRTADKQQQQAYLKNYKAFVTHNFTGRLTEFTVQDYTIHQVREEGEPGEYLVTIQINNDGQPPVYMDYRLRKSGHHFRIFDIIIEGVSLITTQRSEFNAVIDRKGLDFLIEALGSRAG